MFVTGFLFETGAVLGRARPGHMATLVQMFVNPGTERKAVEYCQALGERQLEMFGSPAPDCPFHEFFLKSELAKAGVGDPYETLLRIGSDKLALEGPWERAQNAIMGGLGFGSLHPELVEAMYRHYQEIPTGEERALVEQMGIWEGPYQGMTLEEREEETLAEVADFATKNYPQLLEPLALTVA